ncbi:MAG: hypothetical protein WKG03_00715 [Telluria sp.]
MENKVFRGSDAINGKQVAVVVAASSQRAAVVALQSAGLTVSVRHLASYWSVTGNAKDCAAALSAPGTVFAASSLDKHDYKPVPKRPIPAATFPKVPKIPTDPEERRQYDAARREGSDEAKRLRGERRLTTWLPKEAADALDKLTGNNKERGAVQAALVEALLSCAAQRHPAKRKAA